MAPPAEEASRLRELANLDVDAAKGASFRSLAQEVVADVVVTDNEMQQLEGARSALAIDADSVQGELSQIGRIALRPVAGPLPRTCFGLWDAGERRTQ